MNPKILVEVVMLNKVTIPTFIIGLGGVGHKVASLVAKRFKNSDWEEIPETIRIRVFDSAPPSSRYTAGLERLKGFDFTLLSDFNADEIVGNLDTYPEVKRWWKYNIQPKYINSGAQARRPVGRLVFFHEIAKVYSSLRTDFLAPLDQDLQRRLVESGLDSVKRSPQVFVVGSLAGGTCAGMFLDMAFILRKLLEECGYERGAGIQITGIFGMPSVIEVEAKDGHTAQGQQRRLNAYAALKELDYLLGDLPLDFKLLYPEPVRQLVPRGQIFNRIYLFTDTKHDGIHFSDQDAILKRVAYFIYALTASGTGKEVRDHLDNFTEYFNVSDRRLKDGLKGVYGSFGIEWLEVPEEYLVGRWCSKLAKRISDLVADFDWDTQPKVNLEQTFRERINQELPVLKEALDLLEASPEDALQMADAKSLDDYLSAIRYANKHRDLERALTDLRQDINSILHNLQIKFIRIPDEQHLSNWIRETTLDLIRDPLFRVGGAKRFLKEAARQLRQFDQQTPPDQYEVNEIVKRCTTRRLLLFKKIDTTQAIDDAYGMVAYGIRTTLRKFLSRPASTLALLCDELSKVLEEIQHRLRTAGELIVKATPQDVPDSERQNWLLDPSDIDRALGENQDEVLKTVVDEVAKHLAGEIAKAYEPHRRFDIPDLDEKFKNWLTLSTEKIAIKRAARPQDTVGRLKARMKQCQPLARIFDTGAELKQIMEESKRATPLNLVFTGIGKDKKPELDRWAAEENAKSESPAQKPFGIISTENQLHDDVVYLTLGWPLWLFEEVRRCADAWDHAHEKDASRTWNSVILNEWPESDHHDIRPMNREEAKKWFGVALVLDHIRFRGELIQFSSNVFGPTPDVRAEADTWCSKAFDQFREQGLTWKYKKYIQDRLQKTDDAEAAAKLRSDIEIGLASKVDKLDKYTNGMSATLYTALKEYYELARQYASKLYTL